MRKIYYLLLMMLVPACVSAYTQARVSVHDPSVVWEPTTQTYYVFGSHQAWAKSTDLMNWSMGGDYTGGPVYSPGMELDDDY